VDSLLKAYGYKVDFINAAAGGYTSFESYGRLWSRIRFFKPDVVVVNHGWNDAYCFNALSGPLYKWRDGDDGNFDMDFKVFYESYKPLFIDEFIAWSTLLSAIRLALYKEEGQGEVISDREQSEQNLDAYDSRRTKVYSDNLRLIKTYCELRGKKVFACKQPILPTSNQPPDKEHFSGHGFSHQTLIQVIENEYYVIDTIFKPSQIIDLTSLSGNKEYFYDNVHPTELGTTLIAQIIADSLTGNYFETAPR
jgi:hypothetical protein